MWSSDVAPHVLLHSCSATCDMKMFRRFIFVSDNRWQSPLFENRSELLFIRIVTIFRRFFSCIVNTVGRRWFVAISARSGLTHEKLFVKLLSIACIGKYPSVDHESSLIALFSLQRVHNMNSLRLKFHQYITRTSTSKRLQACGEWNLEHVG